MLLLFSGKGIPIIRSRHTRLRPLFAEGIVILAVEVFAACRRHLRHDARTAQMIGQEVMYLRTAVCSDDPSSAERCALERIDSIISPMIYQRTYIPITVIFVIANGLFRPVCKIRITMRYFPEPQWSCKFSGKLSKLYEIPKPVRAFSVIFPLAS